MSTVHKHSTHRHTRTRTTTTRATHAHIYARALHTQSHTHSGVRINYSHKVSKVQVSIIDISNQVLNTFSSMRALLKFSFYFLVFPYKDTLTSKYKSTHSHTHTHTVFSPALPSLLVHFSLFLSLNLVWSCGRRVVFLIEFVVFSKRN